LGSEGPSENDRRVPFPDTDISDLTKRKLGVKKAAEVRRRPTKNDAKTLQIFASIGASYRCIVLAYTRENYENS
jgi:hypothetical protein